MENIEEARRFFSNDKFATEVTGITIDEVHDGFSRCSLEIEEKHLGAHGQIMGGVIFTLADFAFAAATNSKEHFTATVGFPREKALCRVPLQKRRQNAVLL